MARPVTVVTGATGWLGSNLVRALTAGLPGLPPPPPAAGGELRALVLPGEAVDAAAPGAAVRRVEGDLRDPASLTPLVDGAEGGTLFHCAGVVHPPGRTRTFFDVNVEGTRHVLEAAASHGVARAVVLSSNSPFGFNPDREHRFDEESPYAPYMAYGRSKMAMEQHAREIGARGRIEVVVVRAPWFYGPGQPARQTRFFSMIRRGLFPMPGDGGNLRSMAYVDNLCRGLLLCASEPDAAGETFWIADARPYSMDEIVGTIERLMAREFDLAPAGRCLRLPGWTCALAQAADATLQRAGLYVQGVHVFSELGRNIACSIDKARRRLGYAPQVDLEEGMRRSLRWCLERGIPI